MSTSGVRSDDASGIASVKDVDLKLAVVDIPVSDVDRAKVFDGSLVGGSTRTSRSITALGSSSSYRPARGAGSIRHEHHVDRPARPGAFIPSSRTSDLRAVSGEWDLSPRRARRPGTRATSRSSMAGTSGT